MFTLAVLIALLISLIAVILFVRDATCTSCGHRDTTARRETAPETGAVRHVYTCKHCGSAWERPGGWRWLLRARKVS